MLLLLILSILNVAEAAPDPWPESYEIENLAKFTVVQKGWRMTFSTQTWSGKIVFMGTSVGKFGRTYFLLDGEMVRGRMVTGWKDSDEVVMQWVRKGKLYRTQIMKYPNDWPKTVCIGKAKRS